MTQLLKTVPDLPLLASVPAGSLIPVWSEGVLYSANPGGVLSAPYVDPAVYGALGNGLTDDKAALLLAITAGVAAGLPVSGRGKTYGIAGNLVLVESGWLQDIKFKQLTPGDGVQTLSSSAANDIKLVRVSVDRNGTGGEGELSNDDCTIKIVGGEGHLFEDVEIFGDGMGSAFVVWQASNFDVVRLHVHDLNYDVGVEPSDDVIQPFWFSDCTNFRVIEPRVHDIGGDFGAGYTTRYNRCAFGGCTAFSLIDAQVWSLDQGIDFTGSNGNSNFRVIGGIARDCWSAGWKFSSSARDGVITGATALRCDLYGFFASGTGTDLPIKTGDLTFVNCQAIDIGSEGNWAAGDRRPAGFAVEDSSGEVYPALGIRYIDCRAVDRQAVPTMRYGFMNEVEDPAGLRPNRCIDCVSIGHTTAAFFNIDHAVISWQQDGAFPTKSALPSIELVEHFTNVAALQGLVAATSGAGASFSAEDTSSGRVGIGNCRTGTDTTGLSAVITAGNAVLFGGGRHRLRWDVQLNALSDGTDTYTARVGFLDSGTAEPTDGAYFRYSHSINGGEWQCVTRAAGVETVEDSNIAASTDWVTLEIEVHPTLDPNLSGTRVRFFINGALVATNTTNIPSGANLTGLGASIVKSAGTTGREMRLDLMAYSFEPTTVL
jgi:hypothetical protein